MDIIIKMERHTTGSLAPNYSLTIFGNGTVVYDGRSGVKTQGKRTAHLDVIRIQELIKEFMNLYYFDLEDRYEVPAGSNQPTVTTSIKMGDKSKSIFHMHGSRAPSGLLRLEDKIDKITNSNRWTGL
jgi:Domain of unknown function (DUF6438)